MNPEGCRAPLPTSTHPTPSPNPHTLAHTPNSSADARACVLQVRTKCTFEKVCTRPRHLKACACGTQVRAPPHADTLPQSLSALPCVSSSAVSHSPCEEGPNFSLISFIKRCGEKKRKRRRREGGRGGGGREKEGWGSNRCTMNGALHGGPHHSAPSRGEYGPRLRDTARCRKCKRV